MPRKDVPTDPAEMQRAIDEAIQDLASKGLIIDSGEKRWSERTGRYEIVWKSADAGQDVPQGVGA